MAMYFFPIMQSICFRSLQSISHLHQWVSRMRFNSRFIRVIVPDENALINLIISKIPPAGFDRYATQVVRPYEAR